MISKLLDYVMFALVTLGFSTFVTSGKWNPALVDLVLMYLYGIDIAKKANCAEAA